MNEDKMREEFEEWYLNKRKPGQLEYREVWDAAYTLQQKEIERLEASLREQHQNQLDLMEQIQEVRK